jgi:hypothetical protein
MFVVTQLIGGTMSGWGSRLVPADRRNNVGLGVTVGGEGVCVFTLSCRIICGVVGGMLMNDLVDVCGGRLVRDPLLPRRGDSTIIISSN